MLSDAALLAACRCFQENAFAKEELVARWAKLEHGWRAHMVRHGKPAGARASERNRSAAERLLDDHRQIAARLELRGIDLRLGALCADVAAKIMLDRVIEHLIREGACAPTLSARAGGEGT